MKVLAVVLWLLLGIFYWWMWGSNGGDCCSNASEVSTEASALSGAAEETDLKSGQMGDEANLDADGNPIGEVDEDGNPINSEDANGNGQKGNSEDDLDGDGIPDAEQDFTNEEVSAEEIGQIDPNESSADEAKVVETKNSALIHFPYNSTYKLDSKSIEDYLTRVAERVRQSGEKITLTGHGDITGTDRSNMQIGQYRANTIKDFLVGKGVNPQQILAISKGRTEPIASNKTREGRAKNRRVEIVIGG